jgi:hypothetical protein
MVDVTFLLVVLLGGALVGLVTARVRGHGRKRALLDVAAGMVGGFAGTPLWLAVFRHVVVRIVPIDGMSPRAAALLSDIHYLSPIIGGFVGVGAVSLVYRYGLGHRTHEPWSAWLGDMLKVVGIVYLVVALCLTLALLAVAAYFARWEVIYPAAVVIDLVYGAALFAAGWILTRVSSRPAQSGP